MLNKYCGALVAGSALAATAAAQTAPTPPAPAASAAAAQELPVVRATARGDDAASEGAAKGYKPAEIRQLGPLGATKIEDAPFSINVVPHELIENLQATKPDDLFKINPVLQYTSPQSRFFSSATSRGFSLASTKRIDGIPSTSTYVNIDLEDKERVEVLTGLSGFLYGSGNVGGTLNYVMKRPTYQRENSITAGIVEGSSALVHGDFGGPIDSDGRFAYRVNLAAQDGDTALEHQSINRKLASAALDWNLTDALQLQFDASESHYRMRGTEPYWSAPAGADYPDPPDSSDYYGQPYSRSSSEQSQWGLRLNWRIAEHFGVRAGYSQRKSALDLVVTNNALTGVVPGEYLVQSSSWEYPDVRSRGGFVFADAALATGAIKHKLTLGWYGDDDERTNFRGSGWLTDVSTGFSIGGPIYIPKPTIPLVGAKYTAQRSRFSNLVVGDEIQFTPAWSALLGLNRASIADKSFGEDGSVGARYDDSKVTPTVAVMFKPIDGVSLYASYVESMEKGGTAGETTTVGTEQVEVVNAGDVMPPLMSEQVELGVKATLGQTLLTFALFEIDKGLQYYDISDPVAPVFVQDGRQVHRGIEFTASGRVLPALTLLGGFTLLDPKIEENKSNPALEGKTPVAVAKTNAKVYVEYDVAALRGLTLTGGVFYTGEQEVDSLNVGEELPAFTTVDLGARYAMRAGGLPLVLRAAVSNVTDENYWMSNNYYGRPRTFSLTAQVKF